MLKPEFTGQFKKDFKLAVKRGRNLAEREEVITLLCYEQPLPEKTMIMLWLIRGITRICGNAILNRTGS